MTATSISLYLHIPFCKHRCAYCDFNTYTSLLDLREAYAEGLVTELAQVAGEARWPAHTIFFGGGTPSLMSPASLGRILDGVRAYFALAADAEVTMEANPGTVDLDYLTAVHQAGINRISFGVQSVIPSELALLEREHDFATVVEAVQMARQAGLDNFNLDLIYGMPGQTLPSWEQSLRAVLDLDPAHLSLYCLTIEPGTPMQRWLLNGRIQPPDPDLAADQYELACALLAEHGYDHYEISNWAKPGKACEHNLTYWRNGDYLGLGAGAHGHAAGVRYHIVKQPRVYLRRLQESTVPGYPLSTAVAESHAVSRNEAISDTIMTQLRLLNEGLDLAAFEAKFGQSVAEIYDGTLDQMLAWELVGVQDGRLRLTQKGWFLSNQVFYRFMLDEAS
ncbi:radical SAM family heme chaperone HemW [Candidatus Leptofilum sp.]|uniref:radical SAM family heme chaperone HemW n=1 Tax=Candidatus Leptofilum sp. TaxID=3241576 RepID=UPI003B5B526F